MISIIKIGGKDHSFHFGMRVVWYMSNSGEIEFDEVDGRIQGEYHAFLEMFVQANKAAIDRESSSKIPITKKQLEIAIDDNPKLMNELQNAFKSSKVIEKIQEINGESEKKPEAKKD